MAVCRLTTMFTLVAVSLTLTACGPKKTLEPAINCDEFTRPPDGAWVTAKDDVSLDYLQNGKEYQFNWSKKGTPIAEKGLLAHPLVFAALDKKCAAKH